MPSIAIENSTFERLQRHARPLVDTVDTVIDRALDALEQSSEPLEVIVRTDQERRIDPRRLPNLTHTKVLDASIGGVPIQRPNWNGLLDEMLRCGMKRVGSFERLRQLFPVNMTKGCKKDEGYRHLSDISLSVQGTDANAACRALTTAAQGLAIALDIGFMWRPKEGAGHPGERARLRVAGSK